MSLHSKAVPAEGRKADGPAAVPAECIAFNKETNEGKLQLLADTSLVEGRTVGFTQSQLWHWAMQSTQQPRRVTGEAVTIAPPARCVALLAAATGKLQSVQILMRLTGKIKSRPSAQVGQIEPDAQWQQVAPASVFVRLSQVVVEGASQLPAVGERVEFHLAPNPERADRLWAAEVVPLEDATLATQPLARTSSISADGSGAMSMPESTSVPAQPQKVRSYTPGCRVYVGRLPPEAGWRELQELFFSFGELVHVQLPLDDNGRRRGFAIVELEQPEAASAAVAKLELAELKGQQLVVRNDEEVVNARAKASVYVGNLAPSIHNMSLKEHFKAVDPSGGAHVRVIADPHGQSLGYGFVDFRTQAAADAAVWTLHNSVLEGRTLFLRQDCDMLDQDGKEAEIRRQAQAKNVGLIAQLALWVETAPPLVEWGWSERTTSCWAPHGEVAPVQLHGASRSLAWSQVGVRLRKLVSSRMDASQLQGLYEQHYGERIDLRALGCTTLREVLQAIPSLHLETSGSRLHVAPRGRGDRGGGDRGHHHDRERDRRDDERRRDRPRDRGHERERDRDERRDRDRRDRGR